MNVVPLIDLRSEQRFLRRELLKAWEEALDSASFIGGAAVEQFEKAFADFCEARHAAGVGNGTDALILALKAAGVREGDDVILPTNSFVATAEAVVHAGATPLFVDVNPDTYNIDVGQIPRRITRHTKAIIAVHLYGQPADMDPILEIARSRGLRVIEDSAQAHGARYRGRRAGSLGDVACFSFYPAKNLGACGDGGAIVTSDAEIAERVRELRDHGGTKKYQHDVVGYNSRLDSLQAAALLLKLRHLDARNSMRRRHAQVYNELLSGAEGVTTPVEAEGVEGVFHLYVIRVDKEARSSLQFHLAENGVQTGIHYPCPIHRTPAFARFSSTDCPVAEGYAESILSLPMYPEMEEHHLQYVCSLITQYMRRRTHRQTERLSSIRSRGVEWIDRTFT
jgi:dTDP-4-amino-4,6-dideoxygalactose transaminase